jgi:CSLREA domain-containing protein
MSLTPEDDVDRFGFTRHELLSTGSAVAPAASLRSAPQATFEVTTLADVVDANDGVLSLREAITLSNDTPGLDTITFADSIRGGTIELTAGELTITESVAIEGNGVTLDQRTDDLSGGGHRVLELAGSPDQ